MNNRLENLDEDVRSTLEFAVLDGIAQRGHSIGLTPEKSEVIVPDILNSLLDPSTLWALRKAVEVGDRR